jgi:hypothetical protein
MSFVCLMDGSIIWLDGEDPLNFQQLNDIFNTTDKKKAQLRLDRSQAL